VFTLTPIQQGCSGEPVTYAVAVDTEPIVAGFEVREPAAPQVQINRMVRLQNTSTGAEAFRWFDDRDLDTTGTIASPVYGDTGAVALTLIASRSTGCADTLTKTLAVVKPAVAFTTVFTPNGDGINDGFGPRLNYPLAGFEMQVFDRWGDRVFSTNSPHVLWRGTTPAGNEALEGVYFYQYRAESLDGAVQQGAGSVTVLR